MTHFSDPQLWYSAMEPNQNQNQNQNHKSFPFFYSQSNGGNHSPNYDEDSDNSSSNNHPNRSETASSLSSERDHMFEKSLTPSDVGKLNRLVIPKQHAEKYFPLAGTSSAAGSGGVLLGFEDEAGKCWRFRYSYWNSSQSYVLTKGWSRYVKEKKLDAADVVYFERHRFESDRFFIGWRCRRSPQPQLPDRPVREDVWTGGVHRSSTFYNGVQQQMQWQSCPATHRLAARPYQTECFHAGTEIIRQPNDETQKAAKSGNSKRLRLFGVNLECQLETNEEDPETSDGSSLSSQGTGTGTGTGIGYMGPTAYNYNFDYVGYPPTNHHSQYMGINFSQDLNQMRNHLG